MVILSCGTGLADLERGQKHVERHASMLEATLALCLMHACAYARGEAGESRVVVRVTRELFRFAPIRRANFSIRVGLTGEPLHKNTGGAHNSSS